MNLEANMNAAIKLDEMTPLDYAARICYSSREVLQFSHDMARKYKNIPNTCMIEAGVAAGAQIIAIAQGNEGKVPIYAIDSFQGICLPSNKDNQYPGIKFLSKEEQAALPDPGKQVLESSGATVVDLESFWDHVRNSGVYSGNVFTVKGWFEETLPTFECEPISLLRLDGDLYNSTYVCLKYLYPKVIKGGIIIVDDFGLPGCQAAVLDYWNDNDLLPLNYKSIKDENSHVIYWTK